MNLIENPTNTYERVINAVIDEIYGRCGVDYWFDNLDPEFTEDLIPALVNRVEKEFQNTSFDIFGLTKEDALRLYKFHLNHYISYEDLELIELIRKIGKFANELPG